jgi:hypothetical protein
MLRESEAVEGLAMTIQRNAVLVFLPLALFCAAIYAQPPRAPGAAPVGSMDVAGMRGQKVQEFRLHQNAADCPNCDMSGEYVQKVQPEKATGTPGAGSKQQSASTNATGGGSSQFPEAVSQSKSSSSGGYKQESAKRNDGGQGEQSKQNAQAAKRKHEETMKVLQKSQQNQKETSGAIKP